VGAHSLLLIDLWGALMNTEVTEEITSFLAERQDLEVVDVRCTGVGSKTSIQVLLDKEGGISLDDLTEVNRQLSKKLDEWDPIAGAYMLEVSSAGLERPLTKLSHYQRFIGRKVKILLQPDNERRKISAVLAGVEGEIIILETESETLKLPFSKIKKANLVFVMK